MSFQARTLLLSMLTMHGLMAIPPDGEGEPRKKLPERDVLHLNAAQLKAQEKRARKAAKRGAP